MSNANAFSLKPGQNLGRQYKVLDFLGQGWEGEVYKVEEKETGIIRAAKLFYPRKQQTKPHIAYAKKLYNLRSCSIVIQYHHQEFVEIQGKLHHAMISEFIDGKVLSELIKKKKNKEFQFFEALHLFYKIIKGVEHIHHLGDYHGDIHADNIIVRRKGLGFQVNLIDFLNVGKPSKANIQEDVFQLIDVFYSMLGGSKNYAKLPISIKKLICGRKRTLIQKSYPNAGAMRLYLDNIEW